jgi:hypothetical protein
MKRALAWLSLALLLAGQAAGAENRPALSEGQAQAMIDAGLHRDDPNVEIQLGKVEISHGMASAMGAGSGRDPEHRRYNPWDLKQFKAWEAVGILQVQELKDYTAPGTTSMDDWLRLTQQGVGIEVQLALTDQGKRISVSDDPDVAAIPWGTGRVTKIVDIKEQDRDFERYCLVSGFSELDLTPEYEQFTKILVTDPENTQLSADYKEYLTAAKRKFRALFRFDAYAGAWELFAIDSTGVNGEFITDDIEEAMLDPDAWAAHRKEEKRQEQALRPKAIHQSAQKPSATPSRSVPQNSAQQPSASSAEPRPAGGSWGASLEAGMSQVLERFGIGTKPRQAADGPVLLSQFPTLSQLDPGNYTSPEFPRLSDGEKPVGHVACLAAVYTMIERGREGGNRHEKIDERFYPDPRQAPGGKTQGANPYSYVPKQDVPVNERTILEALRDGRPSILHGFKGQDQHYVLVVGVRQAPDGTQQFVALDPLPESGDRPGRQIEIPLGRLEHPGEKLKGMKFTHMRQVTAHMRGWQGDQSQAVARDPVRQLIDDAIAAHGGTSHVGRLRAMQMASSGTVRDARRSSSFTTETFYQYPDRLRQVGRIEQGGRRATFDTVVKGGDVMVLIDGRSAQADAAYQRRMKDSLQVAALSLLVPFVEQSVELAPIEPLEIQGRWADGVRIVRGDLTGARVYFDRATRLLRKISHDTVDDDGRPILREVVYDAHKDWSGMQYASEIAVMEQGAVVQQDRIDQLRFVEQLDVAVFEVKASSPSLSNAVGQVAVGALLRALGGKD